MCVYNDVIQEPATASGDRVALLLRPSARRNITRSVRLGYGKNSEGSRKILVAFIRQLFL